MWSEGSGTVMVGRLVGFFFQAEDGIRDLVRSRGLGDVYKRQGWKLAASRAVPTVRSGCGSSA